MRLGKIRDWLDSHTAILAGAVMVAVIASLAVFWTPLADWADRHTGVASWFQAAGVFAAVYLSGLVSRREAEKRDRKAGIDFVRSVQAAVQKASQAIFILDGITHFGQALGGPAVLQLEAVLETLTPKRVLELPTYYMVDTAIDVIAGLKELLCFLEKMPEFSAKDVFSEELQDLIDRVGPVCREFDEFARSWIKAQ